MDIPSAVSAAPTASESTAVTSAASSPDHRRLKQAATDFEGLLVAQLLRHARQAGDAGGWMGTGEDKSSESMMEMAEESLARMMASQGCLGLASLMQQGVAQQEARTPTTPSPTPSPAPAKP